MRKNDRFSPDLLLAKAECEPTYFMDFNHQITSYGVEAIYCFVENYDLCFYPHRVADIMGKCARGIPCDGKKNVICMCEYIASKPEYNKYLTRYFVDADFDDNSTLNKRIYVTPCYSIENLYVDQTVVSDILENEYKIRRNDSSGKHQKTIDLFNSELSAFHSGVLLFNAWYRAIKHKGINSPNEVNLEDSFPSVLFNYQVMKASNKDAYSISEIEALYPKAPKISKAEIELSKEYLFKDPKRFRGKYEMQFLYIFFQFLNEDSKTAHQYTVLNRGINWDRKRMISTLEHYVQTPPDMRNYILTGERNSKV